MRLQNGSDIRGVSLEGVEGQEVTLSPDEAFNIACGFAEWLMNGAGPDASKFKVSVGRDPRLSGPDIVAAILAGLASKGVDAADMGLATTPACFMSTIVFGHQYSGSLMCTASHLPWNRNGIKFFTAAGGLKKPDIKFILESAARHAAAPDRETLEPGVVSQVEFMPEYAAQLRQLIKQGVNDPDDFDRPLKGLKIVVDAGNGSGGFFASQVLEPLGADTTGSQFLDPDGRFPNHVPNPEDASAMKSAAQAVKAHGAHLGVIFDTDVDRSGMVDANGLEINKNRLIALLSSIVLADYPGSTIVTDSVTNAGLAQFIAARGGKHLRYKRGYANVISKGVELNNAGEESHLMIETSGHGAMKENFYLDDGAYLAVKIIIAFCKARESGGLNALLEGYTEGAEEREYRLSLPRDAFKEEGAKIVDAFRIFLESKEGWTLEAENYEGWRATIDEGDGNKGWVLIRQSLHDPLLVVNMESDLEGGCQKITDAVTDWLASNPGFAVDYRSMR